MLHFVDKIKGPELLANTEITISVSEFTFIDMHKVYMYIIAYAFLIHRRETLGIRLLLIVIGHGFWRITGIHAPFRKIFNKEGRMGY